MPRHQFPQTPARQQRKSQRAEKAFPGFLRADVRDHLVATDQATGQIRAHIAELRDRDEIQNVKLSRDRTRRGPWNHVDDFGDEIVEPENVKQPEDRVSHRPQRRVVAETVEHLPGEYGQQKKEQDRDLEVVRVTGSAAREIVKAAAQHHGAADHRRDLEVRQAFVIEHAVKFPEREHAERSDQREERDFVAGENDPERDRPEDERACEAKNKNRARRGWFWCGDALERLGHSRTIRNDAAKGKRGRVPTRSNRYPQIDRLFCESASIRLLNLRQSAKSVDQTFGLVRTGLRRSLPQLVWTR